MHVKIKIAFLQMNSVFYIKCQYFPNIICGDLLKMKLSKKYFCLHESSIVRSTPSKGACSLAELQWALCSGLLLKIAVFFTETSCSSSPFHCFCGLPAWYHGTRSVHEADWLLSEASVYSAWQSCVTLYNSGSLLYCTPDS